jgi:hypothetical protein
LWKQAAGARQHRGNSWFCSNLRTLLTPTVMLFPCRAVRVPASYCARLAPCTASASGAPAAQVTRHRMSAAAPLAWRPR